jgi:hypothetical protein
MFVFILSLVFVVDLFPQLPHLHQQALYLPQFPHPARRHPPRRLQAHRQFHYFIAPTHALPFFTFGIRLSTFHST